MLEPLSAERTAEMLLWYFEEPARYRAEGRRRDAPLLDSEVILKLALGRRAHFAGASLNEPKTAAMLQNAAGMYVLHLFFRPDATPYQTLGLATGASQEAIKESFRLLMQLVHPDRQRGGAIWPESFAAQANRAYGILRNQDSRQQFDRDVEMRAAMARAMHRADAASRASMMPVVQRPKSRLGRRMFSPARLPEWLTAGLGGLVRNHPAATAFLVLIGAAVLAVTSLAWEGQEGWLTREVQDVQATTAPAMMAAVKAIASAAVGATPATRSQELPTRTVPVKRSEASDSKSPDIGRTPAVPTEAVPPAVNAVAHASPEAQSASARSSPAEVATPTDGGRAPLVPPAEPAATREQTAREQTAVPYAPPVVPAVAKAAPTVPSEAPVAAVASGVAPGLPASAPAPAVVPTSLPLPSNRVEQVATVSAPAAAPLPPAATEIEALFATFVETYERGRLDAFAALFDEDADTNLHRGRAAIRTEYDELFRLSQWRKMQLTRVNWRRVGDRAIAKGEITVKIGWRDGREVEQRLAMDMELVRRDGRVVIAKLSHQPKS